jgi:hypothetical protein
MTTTPSSPITTYTTLKDTLIQYAQRQGDVEFENKIPYIIYMAQCRISWDLNILGLQKIVTGTWNNNISSIPKPSNWLSTVSITMEDPDNEYQKFVLKKRLREYLSEYLINDSERGRPMYYSDNDFNSYLIAPIPNTVAVVQGYPFTLIYHELLEPLSDFNQINWVTQRVPHLLLYACMGDASIFFVSLEDQAKYKQIYDQALQPILELDKRGMFDRSSMGAFN